MNNKILFLCPHGGAKSVIAAKFFNDAGLPFTADAAAAEDPYDAVPERVAAFLGIPDFTPRSANAHDLANAARIIAIGCSVAGAEQWDDVPLVSEDFERAVAAIRRHVDDLIEEMRG